MPSFGFFKAPFEKWVKEKPVSISNLFVKQYCKFKPASIKKDCPAPIEVL